MERAPLLELQALRKSFGGVQAVRGLDLRLVEHTITGLIGPNGAGKSTTIELISGFETPDSGVVRFRGSEIQGWPPHRISRLGLVRTFQIAREWPRMTVMENLLLAVPPSSREAIWRAVITPRKLRREDAADCRRARRILRDLGLHTLENEFAGNLSGGQKRLVEFARILMARPTLALLDEPLAGVNPVLAERVGETIGMLASEGITILMIEHNMPLVEEVCDSVVVMAAGQQIAGGSMDELRMNRAVVDAYLGELADV